MKIVKTIFFVSSVITAILIIFGVFIFKDVNDFRNNYPTKPSIYVLEKDDELISGLQVLLGEEPKPEPINQEQLSNYQAAYDNDNLAEIKGDNYKLFIFKSTAFDTINTIKVSEETELTREEMFSLLESETPASDYIELVVGTTTQTENLRKQMFANLEIQEETEYKGILFFTLFGSAVDQQGPLFIFDQYKKNNIIIYPETMMFKIIKSAPQSLIEKITTVGE